MFTLRRKENNMAKKFAADLPHNGDAERAVLGSALISNDCLYSVLSSLEEDDFFEGRHQLIYRALRNVEAKHINVDVLTVTEDLLNTKELENVGGVDYLKECSDAMVVISSLEFYINIVKDQSVLRNMLVKIREIDSRYKNEEIEDVDSFIQQAEISFKSATEKRRVSEFKTSETVANEVKLKMASQQVFDESDHITGLTTGFPNLNKLTNGFQKTEMTIVAARPSVGKTALALNFAFKAARLKRVPVAIFSLEMAAELLVKRLIAASSNVSLSKIATGVLSQQEKAKIEAAVREVGSAPIFIDDSPGIKLMDIVARSRQLQAQHPDLGLIIVDYLGLVTTGSTAKGADSRQEEVRKISLALKGLARDLNVPIIVVSQLSRDVEKRDTKRPMLSDLRDSGSIEQDADVVMLLYREDYYKNQKKENPANNKPGAKLTDSQKAELFLQKKQQDLQNEMPGDASYVEVNVAKNRNGQTGTAGLFFYKAFGRFDAPSPEWEAEMRNITAGSVED